MTFSFFFCTEFTEEYPNKPPTVRFISRMFHPNVYADGGICLDILQNRWSPTYDVSAILTSIQSLLDEPNPNSPANSEAAQLYEENRREYEKRVAFIVENSWVHFTIDQVMVLRVTVKTDFVGNTYSEIRVISAVLSAQPKRRILCKVSCVASRFSAILWQYRF